LSNFPIRSIIFDLDGTLVDSEPNYEKADKAFLAAKGIFLAEERWRSFTGIGSAAFIKQIKTEFGLQDSLDDLLADKNRAYLEIAAANTKAFPEVAKFLLAARQAGLKTAIASGSSLAVIKLCLAWSGLGEDNFDCLVSAEEVAHGKPAPDIFLEAARRLGTQTDACLVMEDSRPGVLAAVAAGMPCVAIPTHLLTATDPVYAQATILFTGSMPDFRCTDLVGRLQQLGYWIASSSNSSADSGTSRLAG